MRLLLLAQLRFLARAPWSAVTAVLGVAIAVASVVAVHQIGVTVTRSLDAARPPHLAGLTHLLERQDLGAADYFELRRAWRTAGWPAVAALIPIVEGHLQFDGRRVLVLGADWLAYPELLRARAGARGAPEVAADLPGWRLVDGTAVVVDRSLGLAAGDPLAIGDPALRVAAVVDGGLGPAVYADIATAQRLLGRSGGSISLVGLAARDPWAAWRRALDRLMPGFSAGLPEPGVPPEILAAGFAARAIGSELPAAAFARAILFNVGALGLLALLVAWFLVHQVALIWVERQRPVFVRLHALGVAHAALAAGFVAVFAVLGVLATLAGTGAGLWLADLLIRLSAPDGPAPARSAPPDAILLAKAAFSGFGVCVAGGWLAFRSDVRRARASNPMRFALVAGGLLLLVGGLGSEAAGLLGGFGAILAMSLLMVAGIRPLLQRLRPGARTSARAAVADHSGRAPGATALLTRLALREAVWRPEVVTVALAALALAVATSMGVALMVESLRADFSRMLQARLSGDIYVSGPADAVRAAANWLAGQPDTVRFTRHGETAVRVARAEDRAPTAGAGAPARLGFAAFDAAESARYGYDVALAVDAVLVNERLARELGIRAGDRITAAGGVFRVAHVFPGFGDTEPRIMMGADAFAALGQPVVWDRLSVQAPGGMPVPVLGAALAERFPALEVTEREALRSRAFEVFDRTFALTRALTLLALLVAGVGIYNALTALRLAQAPTRRLLEAQGARPRELGLVTFVRSAAVGGLAVVVALPLGVAMAWVLCRVINPRAFGWTIELHLAPAAWLPPLALGLAATLLAGMLPAPRELGGLDESA